MPRTVTGTYILRPTSRRTYRSSGTFSDWFSTSVTAPSDWTNQLDVGTNIGDNSDSTYFNDSGVGVNSTEAKNAIMNMSVTSGTVPDVDYTITSVKLSFRNKTSSNTSNIRIFRIWNTLYFTDGYKTATPKAHNENGRFIWKHAVGSTSSVSVGTTSITTYSYDTPSEQANTSMPASEYPDLCAICVQAYKTSHFTSFNSYQLYDVWYEVSYSYTEYEKSVQYRNDEGVVVTANGNALDATATYQDYKGIQYPLVATVQPGYILDGYYLNGQKVSSSENYTFTFNNDSDELYCITKKRKIFVGDHQVDEVYIGTTPVSEIYDGDICIWGLSDLYGDATAVG